MHLYAPWLISQFHSTLYSFVLIANISPSRIDVCAVRHRVYFVSISSTLPVYNTSYLHFVVCSYLMHACVLYLRAHSPCSTCILCVCVNCMYATVYSNNRLLSSSFRFDANLYKYHLFPFYYHSSYYYCYFLYRRNGTFSKGFILSISVVMHSR